MKAFPLNLSFSYKELVDSTVILTVTVSFIIYWFLAQSEGIKKRFYRLHEFDVAARKHIFFTKYMGFFILGVLPLILVMFLFGISLAEVGLTWYAETTWFSLFWIVILSIAVVPLAYRSAKKPENLLNYPQIRAKHWTNKTFAINLTGWAIYLFGYELLFRGVLLFLLVDSLGVVVAIAVNVLMYAISHVPKGLSETLGAIPLGLVLCILTLQSGTIWIAFFVHIALSFTNSLTALAYHPEITYVHWNKTSSKTNG
ncbi:MAG: CPBP family intramembrane glutamic endopeptidase [Flavobacteriales bacterium]